MTKIRHRAESLLSRSLLWAEMMPQMVCSIHYSCKNITNIYTNYSLNQVTKIFAFVTIAEILQGMAWILSRIRKNCKIYKETNQILCKWYNWSAQASSKLCLPVKQGRPRICLPNARTVTEGGTKPDNIRREKEAAWMSFSIQKPHMKTMSDTAIMSEA